MKKIVMIVLAVLFVSGFVAQPAQAVILYAGQDMPVGTVEAVVVGENLEETYQTSSGWPMTETHLHVADLSNPAEAIPQKNGNPIPGKFDYSMKHDPPVTMYKYTIPLSWDGDDKKKTPVDHEWAGKTLTIAAHAVVGLCEVDSLVEALPDVVLMCVDFPYPGAPAYLPEVHVWGETALDGTYEGWCIDSGALIQYACLNGDLGIYEAGVEVSGLNEVNWIINNVSVGDPSECGMRYIPTETFSRLYGT